MLLISASSLHAQVEPPRPDPSEAITIGADRASRWEQGAYEVWILSGHCYVNQGAIATRANEAVLWIKRGGDLRQRQDLVIAYLEGNVAIDYQRAGFPYHLNDKSWLGEFFSSAPLVIKTPKPEGEPATKPAVYQNALAKRDPFTNRSIRRTQFSRFDGTAPPIDAPAVGTRRLRVFPRSAVKMQVLWFPSQVQGEWIAVINTGANLIVDGMEGAGAIDIAADRIVLWTRGQTQPELQEGGQTLQNEGTPLEVYLEGNVVFRQGDRVIRADRVYYDINNQLGTILQADMLTPIPTYNGLVRIRAEMIQQTGKDRFVGSKATITTSQLENPTYKLRAGSISFEDIQTPLANPVTGEAAIDPETGEQAVQHQQLLTSNNNSVFLGPLPVFYWPTFTTDLSDPSYFLQSAQYKNDRIFGNQFLTRFNTYQLLGMKPLPGTKSTFGVDYFSMRGLAGTGNFAYNRNDLFGIPGGNSFGFLDVFGIHDTGLDTLGQDRQGMVPEAQNRFRVLGRHRQMLPNDWRLTAELGWISDRNFLEQYFEREWDTMKNESTGVELRRLDGNMSYGITSDVRLNPFFTETQWLPRLDHFWLGQPLVADKLTWYEHTSLGYGQLKVASTPTDPQDAAKFRLLPWEVPNSGERFVTRHELDLPLNLGPGKLVPYVLGEFGHWGADINGNDLDRVYGVAGIRGSIPFWSVNPTIQSELFNVNGIAHKVSLEGDFFTADANQSLTQLPLYDPIDDQSTIHFRRRFAFNTFGGMTPPQFDERFYALRSGLGTWVTSPSAEIADKTTIFQFGANQRWQTKRGPIGNQRIIDWITLDTRASYFPNPSRDDFGSPFGLANYDFRWHVGDRFTLLSNGMFDFFNSGQTVFSVGSTLSRPTRGMLYLGYYSFAGPFNSHVINTSYSYRMSPKWNSTAGVSYDVSGLGLIGNTLTMTRIGESFLTSFNFVVDTYKNNVGFNFMIEPRFMPRTRSVQVPLASANGLE
jgi:hypothetical protein